jgi:hypothetical protein
VDPTSPVKNEKLFLVLLRDHISPEEALTYGHTFPGQRKKVSAHIPKTLREDLCEPKILKQNDRCWSIQQPGPTNPERKSVTAPTGGLVADTLRPPVRAEPGEVTLPKEKSAEEISAAKKQWKDNL